MSTALPLLFQQIPHTESLLSEFRNPRRLWRIFEYQGNPCLPQPGGCGVQIIGVWGLFSLLLLHLSKPCFCGRLYSSTIYFVLWKGQLSRRLIIVFLFVFWLLRSCPTCRDPSRWEATWPCRSSLSACLETCQPSSSCQARLCAGLETSSQNNCPTWCWCTGSPSRACSPRRSRSSTKTLPSQMLRSPSCYQNKSVNLTMMIDNFVYNLLAAAFAAEVGKISSNKNPHFYFHKPGF